MKKLALQLLTTLTICLSVALAPVAVGGTLERTDDGSIFFDGIITKNTPVQLYREYKKEPYGQLLIRSEGGSLDAAFDTLAFMQYHNVAIGVYEYCNSACSILFFGVPADSRYILKDSTLGLHNGTFELSKSVYTKKEVLFLTEDMAKASSKVALLYVKAGIPVNIVESAMSKFGDKSVIIQSDDVEDLHLGTVVK